MTVFNRSAVARFFDAIRTRRVDMIDLADSNSLFSGHGRNHGNPVELSSDMDIDDVALSSSHQCARAGSSAVRVEYDRFWRARNLSAPSIGPVEAI